MQLNKSKPAGGRAMRKWWLALAALFWIVAASAQALQPLTPNELVKRAVETVVKAAQSDPAAKDGNVNAMTKVVRREFLPYTDFGRTTQLAVGSAWKGMTPQQQGQLVEQFTRLLLHTYALQLTQIHDQTVTFSYGRASVNAAGDDAVVHAEVKGVVGGDDLQVAYRLTKTPGGWRIYDIDAMGMWLIQLYQRQLGDQIAKNGVDGLIKYLADHNARYGN